MSASKFMDNLMAVIETYFPKTYQIIIRQTPGQKPPQRNPNE